MSNDLFTLMQQAVDIVGASQHPSNKIAAVLSGKDLNGEPFTIARYNYWPEIIREKLGAETRIGNSSGTVHAETACLLHAPMTNESSLFVTDPPCPNCVKNMVEAGVKKLFIDHKGFDKDFAARRGVDVKNMSLEICRKAGISVYKIFRKDQKIEPIIEIPAGYSPAIEKPARIERLLDAAGNDMFRTVLQNESGYYKDRPFAMAIAEGKLAGASMISAEVHPVAGFTSKAFSHDEKYNFLLQPLHRVLMTAARYGLKINRGYIYSSRVPTARELVNLTGAGFTRIHIGNPQEGRDEHSLAALKQLTDAEIIISEN